MDNPLKTIYATRFVSSLIFDFGNNTYRFIVFKFAWHSSFAMILIGVPAIAIII